MTEQLPLVHLNESVNDHIFSVFFLIHFFQPFHDSFKDIIALKANSNSYK